MKGFGGTRMTLSKTKKGGYASKISVKGMHMGHQKIHATGTRCFNCHSPRRPVYQAGYCRSCFRWHKQSSRKDDPGASAADTYINALARERANIALYELAWREEPYLGQPVDCERLETLIRAIAIECRSGFAEDLLNELQKMTGRNRLIMYKILLSIAETCPRESPVLATRMTPVKGTYLQFHEIHNRLAAVIEAKKIMMYPR